LQLILKDHQSRAMINRRCRDEEVLSHLFLKHHKSLLHGAFSLFL